MSDQTPSPESVCIVRLTTTYYSDKRGLHVKKSIRYLKRKSVGFNVLKQEIEAAGEEEAALNITNLWSAKDGIYEVKFKLLGIDMDTGYADDWNLTLKPISDNSKQTENENGSH